MDTLTIVARGQEGLFTTGQARQAGVDQWQLCRLVRQGRIEHLSRGLYAIPVAPGAGHQPGEAAAGAARRHLRLAKGGLLLYPDAGLSHDSALLAHDLPVWRPHPELAHLVRPVPHQVRRQNFVIDPAPPELVETAHGPSVGVAQAVVQTSRASGILAGVVAADAALRRGVTTPEALSAEAARVAGWPNAGAAAATVSFADPASESPGESVVRVVCSIAGIELVPQFVVRDADGEVLARLDLKVRGKLVGVEFDGRVKYRTPQDLWAEKQREDALRRRGYVIVRVTWADLAHPDRIVARVRAAVRAAHADPTAA